jgi:putative two-component system response regulator
VVAARILVAADDETSARFLRRILTREGHFPAIVSGTDTVLECCTAQLPDLVVIDLIAAKDGLQLCRQLKDHPSTRLVPVVFVTTEADHADRLDAIDAGADDFLTKPFDAAELHARIRSLVRLKRFTDELESAETVILGLGATIEARDPCTRGHCQRLARYASALGRSIGLDDDDIGALERGGFLHDIGKIAVPDSVLLKESALDPNESRVMREHPVVGDALCAGLRSLKSVRPIVRHHHERLDGSGYPDGLRNGAVPLLAQIVGLVDVFDALTTERPYRHPLPRQLAYQMIGDEAKWGWRDRVLVDAFIDLVVDLPL